MYINPITANFSAYQKSNNQQAKITFSRPVENSNSSAFKHPSKYKNTHSLNNGFNPSFKSHTSAGNLLKKLSDITCAYLGIKMIQGSMMNKLEKQLDSVSSITEMITILSKYKENMLKIEKKMFGIFEKYADINPEGTIPECLKELADESLVKLKLEELFVLDDVDMLSRELTPQTALSLRKKTSRCRNIILDDNIDDTFKRKTLITSLDEIHPISGEEQIFSQIKDKIHHLPTSGDSENAFIIKYLNRTPEEIAKRLLRASVATVEHIIPESLGGINNLKNFILTSAYANSYRSNMPLIKFIERFPQIPKNCQKYIEDIISKLNNGKLRGCETYPYDVKRTLEYESCGKIILDLKTYQYTESEALKASQSKFYINKQKNSKVQILQK